jgi:hypothetical protein
MAEYLEGDVRYFAPCASQFRSSSNACTMDRNEAHIANHLHLTIFEKHTRSRSPSLLARSNNFIAK